MENKEDKILIAEGLGVVAVMIVLAFVAPVIAAAAFIIIPIVAAYFLLVGEL